MEGQGQKASEGGAGVGQQPVQEGGVVAPVPPAAAEVSAALPMAERELEQLQSSPSKQAAVDISVSTSGGGVAPSASSSQAKVDSGTPIVVADVDEESESSAAGPSTQRLTDSDLQRADNFGQLVWKIYSSTNSELFGINDAIAASGLPKLNQDLLSRLLHVRYQAKKPKKVIVNAAENSVSIIQAGTAPGLVPASYIYESEKGPNFSIDIKSGEKGAIVTNILPPAEGGKPVGFDPEKDSKTILNCVIESYFKAKGQLPDWIKINGFSKDMKCFLAFRAISLGIYPKVEVGEDKEGFQFTISPEMVRRGNALGLPGLTQGMNLQAYVDSQMKYIQDMQLARQEGKQLGSSKVKEGASARPTVTQLQQPQAVTMIPGKS